MVASLKSTISAIVTSKKLSVPRHAALFHITHWKAGSQWIRAVLTGAFGAENVVEPLELGQQLTNGISVGKVYPCSYIIKQEFDLLDLPKDTRRVVIIRDLRDTLVSWYFSTRNTHGPMGPIEKKRWFLRRADEEQGLLYMLEFSLHAAAYIQRTWFEAGEPVMRLEDFMRDPAAAFGRLFRQHWRMDVPQDTLEQLVSKHSFARYSGGREAGQEDRTSFYRKGARGDWRNHFTPKVLERFKARYNDLLMVGGYEKGDSWGL